ncbi:hypothetical protein PO909_007624 [Leuciscus waleckii]
MDKAFGTILRKRNRKTAFKFGKLEPRNANACGRQVSVLKTAFTWLEKFKSYCFFSRGVKAIRNEIESHESMMFPGPHAFLLVHRDVKDSVSEDIDRPLYEREGKLKSRDDSQSTGSLGIQKPVRRNSLDRNPPYSKKSIRNTT